MSYDLMVFEPEAAPKEHEGFMAWYTRQVKWDEGHGYDDVVMCSIQLQNFYADVIHPFPPIHGVFELENMPDDDASATDYSLGKQAIYACFAWSKAEQAYRIMFDLAAKHGLGFFDVSSPQGEVWLPGNGGLALVHKKPGANALLAGVARFFQALRQ